MNLFTTISNALLWTGPLTQWSLILFIIGGCSLVAMTIFVERIIHLRRSEIDTNAFIIRLRDMIREKNLVEALKYCETTGGTIAAIVSAGLSKHHRRPDEIEAAMEMSGIVELAKLEKNAKILSILAHVAPLIGLLGTVLGFIQAFGEMRLSGLVDISATRIGEAMEYALITTAAGLVVAIPCIIAYNYLVSRIETFVLEIKTTSSEIIDLLKHPDEEFPLP